MRKSHCKERLCFTRVWLFVSCVRHTHTHPDREGEAREGERESDKEKEKEKEKEGEGRLGGREMEREGDRERHFIPNGNAKPAERRTGQDPPPYPLLPSLSP